MHELVQQTLGMPQHACLSGMCCVSHSLPQSELCRLVLVPESIVKKSTLSCSKELLRILSRPLSKSHAGMHTVDQTLLLCTSGIQARPNSSWSVNVSCLNVSKPIEYTVP